MYTHVLTASAALYLPLPIVMQTNTVPPPRCRPVAVDGRDDACVVLECAQDFRWDSPHRFSCFRIVVMESVVPLVVVNCPCEFFHDLREQHTKAQTETNSAMIVIEPHVTRPVSSSAGRQAANRLAFTSVSQRDTEVESWKKKKPSSGSK